MNFKNVSKHFVFRTAKVVVLLFSICVVISAQARDFHTLNKTDEVIETTQQSSKSGFINKAEKDYYSDLDEDYEKQIENIRSVKNWIMTGIAAVCLTGSLIILMTLIHWKSKQKSGLKHLM